MEQPDILERLEQLRLDDIEAVNAALNEVADIIAQLRQRIFDMANELRHQLELVEQLRNNGILR